MSSYTNTLSKHRRLTILRFLAGSPEYTSNASILVEVCDSFGVTSTRDQVAGDIAWLSEQGMVTYEENEGFMVVTTTARGIEISKGKARHDGVKRPRPGV